VAYIPLVLLVLRRRSNVMKLNGKMTSLERFLILDFAFSLAFLLSIVSCYSSLECNFNYIIICFNSSFHCR